ncbi:hypothetical protein B0H10DRAFT_1997805 [Mycena sp. CBHHK59/15]|nr:hypothetical protein B0H10DRAFT_2101648 [Mycena sp. CBHHK59/15]KAJ6627036.1 hypothetical protein B0H10DRAFT_1997805 [Mycena sp. CBHHK59/15]
MCTSLAKTVGLATLFLSVAVRSIPARSATTVTLDLGSVSWETWVSPYDNDAPIIDARTADSKNGWYSYVDGVSPAEMGSGGGIVGFRLSDDHDSAVVYRMQNIDQTPGYMSMTYTGSSSTSRAASSLNFAQLATNFHIPNVTDKRDSAHMPVKREIWTNTTGFQPVEWVRTIDLDSECKHSNKTYVVQSTDGNGDVLHYSGLNELSITLPTALPITVTISTKEHPTDVTTVQYFDVGYLTYKFGNGTNLPTISAVLTSQIYWCPPDD